MAAASSKVDHRYKKFDRLFGEKYLSSVPQTAGVYLFYDVADQVCYVGKAKNLKKRLSQYRLPPKGKVGWKPRAIVKLAKRLEWRSCTDELEAMITETRLIQEYSPALNVTNAFSDYYPYFGLADTDGLLEISYTRKPDIVSKHTELFGAFRSRGFCNEVFRAIGDLMSYWGHREPQRRRYGGPPRYVFRRLPPECYAMWCAFFKGEDDSVLQQLSLAMLENAGARSRAKEIEESLRLLRAFWEYEVIPLKRVVEKTGYEIYPVPQKERDILFTQARFAGELVNK